MFVFVTVYVTYVWRYLMRPEEGVSSLEVRVISVSCQT